MTEKEEPQKKGKFFLGAALLFLLFVGSFCWWRSAIYPYESTDDATIEGVEVAVGAELGGRIVRLCVDEGALVKQGDLLFILDDELLRAEKGRIVSMVVSAQEEVVLQKVKRELASRDYGRARQEHDKGVISDEAFDHAQKGFEAAEAELKAMEAQVGVQQAQLKEVETKLAKSCVYAPEDGIVAKRWHFAGDVVAAGQTVFSVFDLNQIWISANLEETKLSSVRPKDLVKIQIDAYPDREFRGVVDIIGAGAASEFSLIPPNNASGNFTKVTQRVPVRILFERTAHDSELYLRPGMSAEVKIKTR